VTVDPLASPDFPGPRVAAFIARPGFGKTTRALERWWAWPRAIAIDSKHADPAIPPDYPGLVAWTPRELASILRDVEDRERFRVCYRGPMTFPKDPAKPDGETTVEPVFRAIARIPDCLFVVDEAAKWMTAQYTPGKPDGGIFSIVMQGRTMGQALTLCTQRAALIPRDLTGMIEEYWAWPMDEPPDRDYLKARGFDLAVLDSLSGHEALVKRSLPGERAEFRIVR
jgi:hypothetical protein